VIRVPDEAISRSSQVKHTDRISASNR